MSDKTVEAIDIDLDSGRQLFEVGYDSLGNVFIKMPPCSTLRMLSKDAKKLANILNEASGRAARDYDDDVVVDDHVDLYETLNEFIV